MKVTDQTREILAFRRQQRNLLARGYHAISENGYPLWKLHRGGWYDRKITDAVVGVDGMTVFIKIEQAASVHG